MIYRNKSCFNKFTLLGLGFALIFCAGPAKSQVILPLTITSGLNTDIVANGATQAANSTSGTLDNDTVLYDSSYLAYNNNNSAGGTFPAGTTITGAATGNTYNLAAATGNNALSIKSSLTSGTLNLSPISSIEALYILGTAGDGPGNVTYTLNFAGGASQSGSLSFPDWYDPSSSGAELGGIGRVNRSNDSYSPSNGAPFALYDETITVSTPHQALTLNSITFGYNGNGETAIFAVTGEVTSVPEPSTFMLIGLGVLLLVLFRQRIRPTIS